MTKNSSLSEQEIKQLATGLVFKMVKEGKTMQEAASIPDEFLEELYSLAYSNYQIGKYQEAIALFQLLAGANPKNSRYLLGLAASYQETGNYFDAAQGYFLALNANPEDPYPALYAAECYLRDNKKEAARDFLKAGLELAGDKEELRPFKDKCSLLLGFIKNS